MTDAPNPVSLELSEEEWEWVRSDYARTGQGRLSVPVTDPRIMIDFLLRTEAGRQFERFRLGLDWYPDRYRWTASDWLEAVRKERL